MGALLLSLPPKSDPPMTPAPALRALVSVAVGGAGGQLDADTAPVAPAEPSPSGPPLSASDWWLPGLPSHAAKLEGSLPSRLSPAALSVPWPPLAGASGAPAPTDPAKRLTYEDLRIGGVEGKVKVGAWVGLWWGGGGRGVSDIGGFQCGTMASY